MRIAVTGATGFVGGALADQLAAAGHDVLAIGRRPRPGAMAHRYVSWDLAGVGEAPRELLSCEAIVHAAAHVAPWGPDALFGAVIVGGTARLLDAIDPAARLVVIGSASVYDPRVAHRAVAESAAPVAPNRYLNAYGRAKADQERLVATTRPDAVVLRPRAVWGPGDTTLLPRILGRVRRGRLFLPDGGRHPASATHESSLGRAVQAAIDRPEIRGAVNVADATPTTAATLLGALLRALGTPVRIVAVPSAAAWVAAAAVEGTSRLTRRRSEPYLTRYAVSAMARPSTLDLGRLHRELGVAPDVELVEAAQHAAAAIVGAARLA
jgi:nucleoside-diphosphate-sugar epimerase